MSLNETGSLFFKNNLFLKYECISVQNTFLHLNAEYLTYLRPTDPVRWQELPFNWKTDRNSSKTDGWRQLQKNMWFRSC